MPGVVAYAGWDYSGYGNLVVLSHKNGFDSYYAHLSKIEVATGNIVDMNTEIGKMGVTGHSTGSHLHLEIHQNGVSLNPLTVLSR
jgi:murein DD-endopeptidase MepM/ murein hydrolase activator NlpD